MTGLLDIPGNHVARVAFPVAMAAAGTDDEYPAFIAPANCAVVGVTWVPKAAVTHDATNYGTIGVRNRKADASGATLVATRSYVATDSVGFVAEAMTLNATAANLLLAAGDIITIQRVHTASGVVIPAGTLEISYQLR